ncbi:hypothetical protein ACFLTP_07495 [Chloroflexota bacterium]
MQIKKTYVNVKPELLYDEVRDFVLKQGVILGETKLEAYSLPHNSSSHVSRGTLTFNIHIKQNEVAKECARVHIVGSATGETKMLIDIDEALFSREKISALQADLDFTLGSYENQFH